MADITTLNIRLNKSVMPDMYQLKILKNWNWEEYIIETTKFYLLHNPLPEISQPEEVE